MAVPKAENELNLNLTPIIQKPVSNNAKRGIELNEKIDNKCATECW
jgi:hypothetical protein